MLLDESRKRATQITEAVGNGKHTVVRCSSSNEFMTALGDASAADKLLLDVDSWNNGKAIYRYFDVSRRLEDMPVIFYNAPEEFSGIADRPKHSKDHILTKPTETDAIVEAAMD
jgi:DNA-binding NtrC family response regulator